MKINKDDKILVILMTLGGIIFLSVAFVAHSWLGILIAAVYFLGAFLVIKS